MRDVPLWEDPVLDAAAAEALDQAAELMDGLAPAGDLELPREPEERPRHCAGGDTILPTGDRSLDRERAFRLMEVLAPGTSDAKIIVIPGEPPSKSRPRFTSKGKTYKPRADQDAEERTAWHVRAAFGAEPAWTGNVALGCVFFRPNRQRIDVDNMLKHVCDAANGIAWVDDSQVTAVYGVAELDAEHPRTVLVITRHESSLVRGTDNRRKCEHCGKPFQIIGKNVKRFCTPTCAYQARGHDLAEPVECKQCRKPFRRKTSQQVMCSRECWGVYNKGRPRAKRSPRSQCAECGKALNHSRGGRCRECWRANPNPQKRAVV
jgi:Holliday junction resolvase RusA-like endonuclease